MTDKYERRLNALKTAQEMFWRGPHRITHTFKLAEFIDQWGHEEINLATLSYALLELDKADEDDRQERANQLEKTLKEDEDIVTMVDNEIKEMRECLSKSQ